MQVKQGEDGAGYAKLSCAWEYFEGGGGFLLGPLASMMKATAAMNLGRFLYQASRLLDEALMLINRTDHRMHEAEVYRVLGKLQQQRSNPDVGAAESLIEKPSKSRARKAPKASSCGRR